MKVGQTFTERELDEFLSEHTGYDRRFSIEKFCCGVQISWFNKETGEEQYRFEFGDSKWYTRKQFLAIGKNPNIRLLI
jgi:hypothetical protein